MMRVCNTKTQQTANLMQLIPQHLECAISRLISILLHNTAARSLSLPSHISVSRLSLSPRSIRVMSSCGRLPSCCRPAWHASSQQHQPASQPTMPLASPSISLRCFGLFNSLAAGSSHMSSSKFSIRSGSNLSLDPVMPMPLNGSVSAPATPLSCLLRGVSCFWLSYLLSSLRSLLSPLVRLCLSTTSEVSD